MADLSNKVNEKFNNDDLAPLAGAEIDDAQRLVDELVTNVSSAEESEENPGNMVVFSEDLMMASVRLVEPAEGSTYTVDDIMRLLKSNGVIFGISESAVKRLVFEKRYFQDVGVAFGVAAKDGKDAKFLYSFNTSPKSKPVVLEDGSVDFRNMQCFESVKKNQLIATYEQETAGENGRNVKGQPINAKRGKSKPAIRGKHIVRDGDNYYSDTDGRIDFNADTGIITITDIYTVDGDVDASTGNINFAGNVEIKGNVLSGYMVEAKGSVTVNGVVEAATIKAGKDVMIRKGMSGNGRGFIIAGGNVEGKYFEQVNIECQGYLHTNSILNCFVDCNDVIEVSGAKGVLLAGRVRALKGIVANNIGNENFVPTYVKVGIEPRMRQNYYKLKADRGKLEEELKKITEAQNKLKEIAKVEDVGDKLRTIMRLKISKNTEFEEIKAKCEELEAMISEGEKASIKASRYVYEGTLITVNGINRGIKETVRDVKYSLKEGSIEVTTT